MADAANEAANNAMRAEGRAQGQMSDHFDSGGKVWIFGVIMVVLVVMSFAIWILVRQRNQSQRDNFQNLKKDKRRKKQRFSKQFKRLV